MITAKCIGASLGNYKAPLYTFECEIPRIIVAELNKHRALSNSIESSRAVPLEKMIDKVRDNMFIPVFTKNQAGMQGYKINKNPILSDIWEEAAMSAVDYAEELFLNHGIHKQVCNRLIENFTYVKCILSGTDWDNFFNLRIHHTAEPHIRELAIAIYKEMRATAPMKIEEGEWHVPYIERKRDQYGAIHYRHPETHEELTEEEAIKLSIAMCAQVSYRNIDSSDDKVRKVLDRLFPLNEPIHAVPCEHVATPADIMEDSVGNFYGWLQYRHTIENNTCYNFTHGVFEKRINEINKLMDKDSKMSSDMFTPVEDFSIAYPWAVEYMNKQASIFWPAHEVKVEKDIHDIQTNCTEAERHAIMETLRLFTKYEQIIGEESWTGRFANTFKRHELVSMATLFGAMELSVHKIFYSKINDLLNAADPDFYTSWKEDPTLTERMNQITAILDHPRDAVYLGGFALLEGAVLYSSFAFLKHFQVNGKNKMVHTVSGINFSSRDENLHCHAAAHVFREFTLSEQDREDLIVLSHNIRENEYAIIDKLFEKGEIEGITAQDLKQFVKHRVSFVMNLLGLVEEVEDAGVVGEWYYPSVDSFKMNDFFITTNNEYLRKFREEDFTWE